MFDFLLLLLLHDAFISDAEPLISLPSFFAADYAMMPVFLMLCATLRAHVALCLRLPLYAVMLFIARRAAPLFERDMKLAAAMRHIRCRLRRHYVTALPPILAIADAARYADAAMLMPLLAFRVFGARVCRVDAESVTLLMLINNDNTMPYAFDGFAL